MDCLISVIVPVYKVEKYIHRCVDSVLNQTFTDFELILVDDGSPDNCGAICDEYALKDNRIHVIHKENGGLSDARNAGIDWAFEHSDSEWLTFIDSDDWVHPKYLESLYNAVIESGCSISVCGYQETTGEDPDVDENQLRSIMVDTEQFFCEHTVNATVAWGKIFAKNEFRYYKFPFGKIHEDEFTIYRIIFGYDSISVVNQPLYCYFFNSEGISKSQWSIKKLDAIEAHQQQIQFFRRKKNSRALLCVVDLLFYKLIKYYKILQKMDSVKHNEKSIRIIRRSMRLVLKEKNIKKPIDGYKTAFDIGHPYLMKLFRVKKRIKKKLIRIFAT